MTIENFSANCLTETPQHTEPSTQHKEKASVSFLARCIATGFFSGYSPLIPGTAGSIVGLLLYAIPGIENTMTLASLIIVMFFIGTATAAKMERHLGEDPQVVVIDEIVGMWISLLLLPKTLTIALMGFFFFRVYDTIKPQPARYAEHFKHGWGIMLDDVVAAIYANVSVRLVLLFFFKS